MLDPSYSPETLSGQKCIPAALEAFCEPMISNPRLSAHTSGGASHERRMFGGVLWSGFNSSSRASEETPQSSFL